jgi:sterol desaturase/sphingolipid hydroxylase (fatty acid hydroxylase superfamily)
MNTKNIIFFSSILIAVIFFSFFVYLSILFSIRIVNISLSSYQQILSNFSFSILDFFVYLQKPLLFILGTGICFIVEGYLVGWNNCSFRSIINLATPSARTDIFYIWLKISGLSDIIFNLIFLGFGFYFISIVSDHSLIKINNYIIEFILTVFLITFIHYFYHRALHHPALWELHKLHHSADEMNIFTASREHPLVVAVYVILISVPSAIFGIRPEVIFVYKSLEGFYNLFLHSKVDLFPKFTKSFMISTADHHIHHSTNPAHHNTNFGMVLNIWDKIFSTYFPADKNKKINFGIEDPNYNKNLFFYDILIIPTRWIRGLLRN